VLRPPASRLVADENFVIDTARMRLIAAQLAHLRTELAEPSQLAALLGVEVPASWPPGEYDRDAIVYFLSQYEIRGPEATGWYGWYAVRRAEGDRPRNWLAPAAISARRGRRHRRDRLLDRRRGAARLRHRARAGADQPGAASPGVRRVIAHVQADNIASHKVLKRAGFHFAAVGASASSATSEWPKQNDAVKIKG
jgi:hypothetical protein